MPRKLNPPALPDITDPDLAQEEASDTGASQIETETGVDFSAASALDADHVLADEESTRWLQAPD